MAANIGTAGRCRKRMPHRPPGAAALPNLARVRADRHFPPMQDPSLVAAPFRLGEGSDGWALFTADGPGRVVANVRDYRADAWMSKVIP